MPKQFKSCKYYFTLFYADLMIIWNFFVSLFDDFYELFDALYMIIVII
jgi:hypothetical protein